jgi:hypothetical protein
MTAPRERYVPDVAVRTARHDDVTVLTSERTGERHTISGTGLEVWSLLQDERHTVDRLVMALARRSPVQTLDKLPDLVREHLDSLVRRGLVERIVSA